jgi:hypothetical protein
MRAMNRGDLVEAIHHDYGPGLILGVAATGLLEVAFEVDGHEYRDLFHAMELEIARPALKRVA